MPQLSKYPLTLAEISKFKVAPAASLVPVYFKGCEHKASVFSPGKLDLTGDLKRYYDSTGEIKIFEGLCWGCQKARK